MWSMDSTALGLKMLLPVMQVLARSVGIATDGMPGAVPRGASIIMQCFAFPFALCIRKPVAVALNRFVGHAGETHNESLAALQKKGTR